LAARELLTLYGARLGYFIFIIVVALKRSFLALLSRVWAVKGFVFSGAASALDCFFSADFPAPLTVLFWIGMASNLSSRFRETAEFE
jgi:hypothetical protein